MASTNAASGGAQGAQRAAAAGSAANAAGAARSAASTVTLSPAVSQLQGAMALAGSGEVFDAKQVASIKQAITNGQFQVNPEKVADKLIQSVQEMLTARGARQGA